MPTILVADDDAHIREVVTYALEREDMRVLCVDEGHGALSALHSGIDLVILDVLMPGLDGLSVCREIRKNSQVPIIFLSSRGEEVDRVLGLELGGDDYLTKPFSPRELVARVRGILRRTSPQKEEGVVYGPIRMLTERHEVFVAEQPIVLTVTEFAVLLALLERPGRVLTREKLIARAYTHDHHITERTIDTFVRRIRAKLRVHGVDPIETVHGLGYKAAIPAEAKLDPVAK